jgi:hypothetical protein
MSIGLRADSGGTSGAVTINGSDKLVITNAGNITATTFTGALVGNADTATKFAGTTGTAPVYGVRAWVNFDGTRDNNNTVNPGFTLRYIRAAGNVSQVLKNATGDYTITFSTELPNGNYSVSGFSVCGTMTNVTGASIVTLAPSGNFTYLPLLKTSAAFRILVGNPNNGNPTDSGDISITVVG